jgi:uncharacterized protein with FMN-binding domain
LKFGEFPNFRFQFGHSRFTMPERIFVAKSGKISNSLVTLSSAAILAIYAAGYERTSPAAAKFAVQQIPRRGTLETPSAGRIETPFERRVEVGSIPGVRSAPMQRERRPERTVINTPSPVVIAEGPSQPTVSTPPAVEAAVAAASTSEATEAPVQTAATTDVSNATPAPAPITVPASPPPQVFYRDGTYTGWGYSRHGDIQASVVIQDGRIFSAEIAQCLTRYSCSWISHLPGQVISRQSPEVDYVSGATQSTDAYYGAVVEALNKAK